MAKGRSRRSPRPRGAGTPTRKRSRLASGPSTTPRDRTRPRHSNLMDNRHSFGKANCEATGHLPPGQSRDSHQRKKVLSLVECTYPCCSSLADAILAQHRVSIPASSHMVTSLARDDIRPPAADLLPHSEEASQVLNDRVIQAYEQERLRLAREIHDGPAQVLANAIFELEYFERLLDRDPMAVKGQLAQLKRDIRNGLADVRRFILDLRPPALSEMGLFPALSHYVMDYQRQFGIEVDAQLPDTEQRHPATKEVAVFRIVQEALQNVRRHAAASRVIVRGRIEGNALYISVEDNGRGFDPSEVSSRHSRNFGLTSMRERAELIDADLLIESAPGRGTRVALTAPLD